MKSFEGNEILEKLPKHLLEFVIDQPFNQYTARDHAVWRYVMRQNVRFLSKLAYGDYMDGLEKTGITIDSIPQMYGMNRILKNIGWAAVAVDGFIPPQAFMEFQAHKVLVIAADIRNVNHIEYTPAPDILHEAAGHAPIIANKEYAKYLELFGEIGAKAFSSKQDYAIYEAIRHLSIIKEDPSTALEDVQSAEKQIEYLSNEMGLASEMALLRNLHWWTVEYGLIGKIDNFKLYGAGLLSSIGESQACLSPNIKKLPYSLEAQNYSFDITNMQPHLFVTKDFTELIEVLNQYADTMAFRKGGAYGLKVAKDSASVATIEFNTQLQLTGEVESYKAEGERVHFIKLHGPCMLSLNNKKIEGQGIKEHSHGYSTPVGIPHVNGVLGDNDYDWTQHIDKSLVLTFPNNIIVKGQLSSTFKVNGKTLILSITDCTATHNGDIIFKPEWGMFDVVLAESITSVYYGPADPENFQWHFESPKEKTHKLLYSDNDKAIFDMYQKIRDFRNNDVSPRNELEQLYQNINLRCPDEWLLKLELLELSITNGFNHMSTVLSNELNALKERKMHLDKLISDGLAISSLSTEKV